MALRFHARRPAGRRNDSHLIRVKLDLPLRDNDIAGIGACVAIQIGKKAVGVNGDRLA